MQLTLASEIADAFPQHQLDSHLFEQIMSLQGSIYRALENRKTQRIFLDNKAYFIKQHYGVGWKEIFKNIFQFRLPIVSAKNEWQALQKLHGLGIATQQILGYGYKGKNPARKQSFLITRELPEFVTLEDFVKTWGIKTPEFRIKYRLIQEIARISNKIHSNGINHRDFYICHFLLDLIEYRKQSIKLFLIDLHRAQIRRRTPSRWIIKDLAGLYFSTRGIGLTQRDLFRFMKLYRQQSLREILNKERNFWRKVKSRGDKLFQKHEKT